VVAVAQLVGEVAMTHNCPVSTCTVTGLPDSKLMCWQDWSKVPPALQRAVYRAYDKGRGLGSEALRAAQDAAIAAVERQLARPPKPSPHDLWKQAGGGTAEFSRQRFLDLMTEAGHLLRPGDEGYEQASPGLPCGWPGEGTRS
jgi:hypothetical protein